MYFHKTNFLFRLFYPHFLWIKPPDKKVIYLTFDDGPIPGVTQFVLDALDQYGAKATFFCVGDNVAKHPTVYQQILFAGHAVGNHTFNHLNGWKTDAHSYLSNVEQCSKAMNLPQRALFRPPYGRVTKEQQQSILREYQVVMWDVLTGDFDRNLLPEKCLKKSIKYTEDGSIVIFHDSLKAEQNLRYVLPRYLEHFAKQGYRFEALT